MTRILMLRHMLSEFIATVEAFAAIFAVVSAEVVAVGDVFVAAGVGERFGVVRP